jgi:5'-3' exoribonuclease 2
MGIAGFFLWLQRYYPAAIQDVDRRVKVTGLSDPILGQPSEIGSESGVESEPESPVLPLPGPPIPTNDYRSDNGGRGGSRGRGRGGRGGGYNGPRFEKITSVPCDNLYLDMNGLIHPCCHDTAPRPEPESEDEMMTRIYEAVDKLVELVRPKKVLYMAIDGVAPRSKMNQQRARRFRAAAERQEANEIARRMADVVVEAHQLPRPSMRDKWDHNVITPSTHFMERVGQAIEWYIVKRLNSNDPEWKDLTVILSDAHVPGEGEHKIMQFIRALRAQPGFDPNTRHVIHGQDADLIMLGLATHELHFGVLRNSLNMETFQAEHDKFCVFDVGTFRDLLQRDMSAISSSSSGGGAGGDADSGDDDADENKAKKKKVPVTGGLDFERVVDDFIFMCFFIGNDFLPHMPLVDIKCKGIETILDHYVRNFDTYGHLTDRGVIDFDKLRDFVGTFAEARLPELVKLKEGGAMRIDKAHDRMRQKVEEHRDAINNRLAQLTPDNATAEKVGTSILKLYIEIAKEQLRLVAGKHPIPFEYGVGNYRDEYYRLRFGWQYRDAETGKETKAMREQFEAGVKSCVREYLRGMQWVMWYYTKGCPSWEWFYPYYYAPLLQDVGRYCHDVDIEMKEAEPLHPVEQLLAVLPRESVHALPQELHRAVLDETSVLAKFYPKEMHVDYTEAIHSWQGVIQLPFVNCKRLQKAVREVVRLEPDEGWNLIFCCRTSPLSKLLERTLPALKAGGDGVDDGGAPKKVVVPAEVAKLCPLSGAVGRFAAAWPLDSTLRCPDEGVLKRDPRGYGATIARNEVATYHMEIPGQTEYNAALLRGARRQKKQLTHSDVGSRGRGGGWRCGRQPRGRQQPRSAPSATGAAAGARRGPGLQRRPRTASATATAAAD